MREHLPDCHPRVGKARQISPQRIVVRQLATLLEHHDRERGDRLGDGCQLERGMQGQRCAQRKTRIALGTRVDHSSMLGYDHAPVELTPSHDGAHDGVDLPCLVTSRWRCRARASRRTAGRMLGAVPIDWCATPRHGNAQQRDRAGQYNRMEQAGQRRHRRLRSHGNGRGRGSGRGSGPSASRPASPRTAASRTAGSAELSSPASACSE